MKSTILLLALAAASLSSCVTAYKTGQTPDDVYFSPAPPQDEYVSVDNNDDRKYSGDAEYYDDRYLRMKVHNRAQWSTLDDWNYYNYRYDYSMYNDWNNPWSPSVYWNYYYNPYCNSCCVLVSKGNIAIGKPRTVNLNTYNSYNTQSLINKSYSNFRLTNGYVPTNNSPKVNTRVSNSRNSGNLLRNLFNSNNDNNNSSSTKPSSSSSGSSTRSSSSSSSSSSGSSAPVRRF